MSGTRINWFRLFPAVVTVVCFVVIHHVRITSTMFSFVQNYISTSVEETVSSSTSKVSIVHETTLPLPDWRIVTDCSVFALDCVTHAQNSGRYRDYPFDFTSKNIAKYDWNALKELPKTWRKSLDDFNSTKPLDVSSYYEYPPIKSKEDVALCMKRAREPFDTQMDLLLTELDRTFDMISFTISDYNYAYDMIHEVFEMAWDVVGFKNSFFMVALDRKTARVACRYGYPVLSLANDDDTDNNLKSKVANSKFDLSKSLVDRGVSFFFFEMDVFFIKSPRRWLENQTEDLLISSHQNNPTGPNIGVYSVLANNATREFFKLCVEWNAISPSIHDQWLMSSVWWANQDIMQRGREFSFGGSWHPKPPIPDFKYSYNVKLLGPHEIVADERMVPTERTIAMHPLSGAPLRSPHGKKWVAKELGAWYGFRGPLARGGYYHRQDEYRRYLWIDGRVLGGYSTVQGNQETGGPGFYHDERVMRLTIATAVAVARRSHRIFILPKLVRDRGVYFLWRDLDLQSLESLVEVRETNFMSNPKSWFHPTVPLQSVARTAYGADGRLFAQFGENSTTKAWKASKIELGIDALFAIATAIPEIHQTEALLFNPYFMERGYRDDLIHRFRMKRRLSAVEQEIMSVYKQLKWCNVGDLNLDAVASVARSEWDCYGRGVNVDL